MRDVPYCKINVSFLHYKGTSLPATLSTYRINNTNGATCILIRTDALLSVSYRDKLRQDKELGEFVLQSSKKSIFASCI